MMMMIVTWRFICSFSASSAPVTPRSCKKRQFWARNQKWRHLQLKRMKLVKSRFGCRCRWANATRWPGQRVNWLVERSFFPSPLLPYPQACLLPSPLLLLHPPPLLLPALGHHPVCEKGRGTSCLDIKRNWQIGEKKQNSVTKLLHTGWTDIIRGQGKK